MIDISTLKEYIKVLEEDGLHSYNENYDTMTFSEDENVYLIGRVLGILEPESILFS